MDIALYDETNRVQEDNMSMMEDLIKSTSQKIGLTSNFEVSVIIVDNKKIKKINKEYRKINEETDVISFAIEDEVDNELDQLFETSINNFDFKIPKLLGDIFISIDKAEEQAKDFGHSLERELGFLVVHGFLHLNGYNHETKEEETEMFNLQNKILEENHLER